MMTTGSRFAHILEKGSGKFISPVFCNEFKLATNKTLGWHATGKTEDDVQFVRDTGPAAGQPCISTADR